MPLVKVDHNYPISANLKYQTISGSGVENAVIRVFTKTAFDQGLTTTAIAVTMTNIRGEWVNPVYLESGVTYTIQFSRETLFGPDKVEIVC